VAARFTFSHTEAAKFVNLLGGEDRLHELLQGYATTFDLRGARPGAGEGRHQEQPQDSPGGEAKKKHAGGAPAQVRRVAGRRQKQRRQHAQRDARPEPEPESMSAGAARRRSEAPAPEPHAETSAPELHERMVAMAEAHVASHPDEEDKQTSFGYFVDEMLANPSTQEDFAAWMDSSLAWRYLVQNYSFSLKSLQWVRTYTRKAIEVLQDRFYDEGPSSFDVKAIAAEQTVMVPDFDFVHLHNASSDTEAYAQVMSKVLLKAGTFHVFCMPEECDLEEESVVRFRVKTVRGKRCLEARFLGTPEKYPVLQPWVTYERSIETTFFGRRDEALFDPRADLIEHQDGYFGGRAFEVRMFQGEPVLHVYRTSFPSPYVRDIRTRVLSEVCIGATSKVMRDKYLAHFQHLGKEMAKLKSEAQGADSDSDSEID